MIKKTLAMTIIVVLLGFSFSLANSDHSMGSEKRQMMKMPSTDVFADGVQATFMVMKNESHENMLKQMKMNEDIEKGSTHNIMILLKDEMTGREFANIPVTIVVTDQNDNEQRKRGSYKDMMRTYDAYFKMSQSEKYEIRIVFETEGTKRSIGVSHEMN